MGMITIAGYRPKDGCSAEDVLAVLRTRLPLLRSLGLSTDRESVMMQATDGTILEVSEWVSQEAIDAAHENPQVLELWARFEQVCTYAPLHSLAEAHEMFASFPSIETA